MDSKKKALIALVLFAVFLGGVFLLYNALLKNRPETLLVPTPTVLAGNSATRTAPGETDGPQPTPMPAPDFKIYDESGKAVNFEEFVGKPIILNFWASWCGPCKTEMPVFQKVYEETKDDIVFLMVNLTDGAQETKEKAQKYIQDNGYTFPIYLDSDSDAAATYGIYSIPTTIFINAKGEVEAGHSGVLTESLMRQGIALITG